MIVKLDSCPDTRACIFTHKEINKQTNKIRQTRASQIHVPASSPIFYIECVLYGRCSIQRTCYLGHVFSMTQIASSLREKRVRRWHEVPCRSTRTGTLAHMLKREHVLGVTCGSTRTGTLAHRASTAVLCEATFHVSRNTV